MLDFTSSLYLGLRHPSRTLEPWESLTVGAPAALSEPERYRQVARDLARLQGCETGVLGTSTLHLFWDLFGTLARDPVDVFVDSGAYPIACWGGERARARGAFVSNFPHHDVEALRRLMTGRPPGRRPVVVSDGFCPACGKVAPVAKFLRAVQPRGGLLVLDDTQALGILGEDPSNDNPYGKGGGGSLRFSGVSHPSILVISSLAKGLGAPLAVLSGSPETVGLFTRRSETRMHCSPPSQASVGAARRALILNRERGDVLRQKLLLNVVRFRQGVREMGGLLPAGIFPFQPLCNVPGSAVDLHRKLAVAGVRAVLHRPRSGSGARVSFVFTALHTPAAIDRALEAIRASAPA